MIAAGLVAGCGSGSKPAGAATAGCTAETPAHEVAAPAALPAGFPTPRGITYGLVTSSGATRTVAAFSTSPLPVTFDLYRRDLAVNPYSVTNETLSKQLGLIDFRGHGISGRVQLTADCKGIGGVVITFQ
jgi:hypothetical protein